MQGKITVDVHYYEQGNVSHTAIFIYSHLSRNKFTLGPAGDESRGVNVVTAHHSSVFTHTVRG